MKRIIVLYVLTLVVNNVFSKEIQYVGFDTIGNTKITYRLILDKDTFKFSIGGMVPMECKGEYTSYKNVIAICNCFEENDLATVLSRNYMSDRKHVFYVKTKRRLYYFPNTASKFIVMKKEHVKKNKK